VSNPGPKAPLRYTGLDFSRVAMPPLRIPGPLTITSRFSDGTIGAALLGQAIPFAMPGDDIVWAGFGGVEVALRTGNIAMFLAGEYYAFSDSSNVASTRGGIRVSF
jgi:hypothetical protein